MRDIQIVLERWGAGHQLIILVLIIPLLPQASKDFYRRQAKPDCHVLMMMRLSLKVA